MKKYTNIFSLSSKTSLTSINNELFSSCQGFGDRIYTRSRRLPTTGRYHCVDANNVEKQTREYQLFYLEADVSKQQGKL